MNANYDPITDTLTIILKPGLVEESDEEKNGVILDYDAQGTLLSLEILDASKHIPDVTNFNFNVGSVLTN
jgi:uncharacterized protein YuzE